MRALTIIVSSLILIGIFLSSTLGFLGVELPAFFILGVFSPLLTRRTTLKLFLVVLAIFYLRDIQVLFYGPIFIQGLYEMLTFWIYYIIPRDAITGYLELSDSVLMLMIVVLFALQCVVAYFGGRAVGKKFIHRKLQP